MCYGAGEYVHIKHRLKVNPLTVFDLFLSVLIAIPVTIIIWLGWRIPLLDHASLHTHTHIHSLSLVVVMMKAKEFKTKIYSHAHSLILSLSLSLGVDLCTQLD